MLHRPNRRDWQRELHLPYRLYPWQGEYAHLSLQTRLLIITATSQQWPETLCGALGKTMEERKLWNPVNYTPLLATDH